MDNKYAIEKAEELYWGLNTPEPLIGESYELYRGKEISE